MEKKSLNKSKCMKFFAKRFKIKIKLWWGSEYRTLKSRKRSKSTLACVWILNGPKWTNWSINYCILSGFSNSIWIQLGTLPVRHAFTFTFTSLLSLLTFTLPLPSGSPYFILLTYHYGKPKCKPNLPKRETPTIQYTIQHSHHLVIGHTLTIGIPDLCAIWIPTV